MLKRRSIAGVVKKNDAGEYWLTGGYTTQKRFLRATEIFQPKTRSFSPGPALPIAIYGHCVVQTSASKFIVIGGVKHGNTFLSTVRQYDFDTNTWSLLASMPIPQQPFESCHLSTQGTDILVGGKECHSNTVSCCNYCH